MPPAARNRVVKMVADDVLAVGNSQEYEAANRERSVIELSQDPETRFVHVIVRADVMSVPVPC